MKTEERHEVYPDVVPDDVIKPEDWDEFFSQISRDMAIGESPESVLERYAQEAGGE